MPREQFCDGVVHERSERFLTGLVAADHGVVTRHHHAGKLHAAAAAGKRGQRQWREPTEQEGASIQSIREAHTAAPFA
jgi:hypothetical protein